MSENTTKRRSVSVLHPAGQKPIVNPLSGVHYYLHETNRCPGCGGTSWDVGRIIAQCMRCEYPLELHYSTRQPPGLSPQESLRAIESFPAFRRANKR